MLTVVLDANILVSALITPQGEGAAVLESARSYKLYLSEFILSEVQRTLHSERIRKKYRYPDSAIARHIADLLDSGELVEPQTVIAVCRDDDDNAVLACALEARVEYLVTRNTKHFPRSYAGVAVITPGEFLTLVRS